MEKSVLISIQTGWCEIILKGEKTIEIRKTMPKLETPFKVYIYCTKPPYPFTDYGRKGVVLSQKVIGEFVCDEIGKYYPIFNEQNPYSKILENFGCLTQKEIYDYALTRKGNKEGFPMLYGWHISDLKIYDKPKELNAFSKYGFNRPIPLKRPPQSWCYVEGED